MLLSLAQAVDSSSIVHTLREIAIIGAMVNVFHLLALAVFAGALLIVDLRFMGTGLTREPLAEIASQARPWLVGGFWALVVTGLFQLALQPVKEYYSEMFNFKRFDHSRVSLDRQRIVFDGLGIFKPKAMRIPPVEVSFRVILVEFNCSVEIFQRQVGRAIGASTHSRATTGGRRRPQR